MTREIKLVTEPLVAPIAEMEFIDEGLTEMLNWVGVYRPECLPSEEELEGRRCPWTAMFPTGPDRYSFDSADEDDDHRDVVSWNELLVELAGRTCYHSYGLKAGRKTNREYIANMQGGSVPHASVLYHAKMSFFIANVSRRVSHELIRNYVGADRTEEGSPSQESTRYTRHPGHYVVPPYILERPRQFGLETFRTEMQRGYDGYLDFIDRQADEFEREKGEAPKGMDRKRIYEAASFFLHHSVTTSFVWTTNPMALRKLWKERCDENADAEFQRFAKKWRAISLRRWPNLFPGVTNDD
jgi:thymidylate synthase (FAD)